MNIDRKVFHPVRNERLKQLLDEYGISTFSLTHLSKPGEDIPQEMKFGKELYEIVNGKRELSEKNVKKIMRLVPQFVTDGIRFEWLMGYDDIKTETDMDYIRSILKTMDATTKTAQSKFYGLNLFLKQYGYRVVDLSGSYIPPIKDKLNSLEKDSAEYWETLGDMHDALNIRYAVLKDGEVIARFGDDTLDKVYDTVAEMIGLVFSRL